MVMADNAEGIWMTHEQREIKSRSGSSFESGHPVEPAMSARAMDLVSLRTPSATGRLLPLRYDGTASSWSAESLC